MYLNMRDPCPLRAFERFTLYEPSETVVMSAAFFLLEQGLLNIPDVCTVNVKQARAFLWNAAWLQEHPSPLQTGFQSNHKLAKAKAKACCADQGHSASLAPGSPKIQGILILS